MKKTAKEIQNIINRDYGRVFSHNINPIDIGEEVWNEKTLDELLTEWLEKTRIANRNLYFGKTRYKVPSIYEHISLQTWYTKLAIHFRDGYVCCLCGKNNPFMDETVNVDHIIPKSKFPCSHPWNLQSTCADCNIEKSDQLLDAIPIYLEGARYRSDKFFKKQWTELEVYRFLNIEYKTIPKNNNVEELKNIMSYHKEIISKIIEMPDKWNLISMYLANL